MTKIVEECPYNGVSAKIDRLGLAPLLDEIRSALTSFDLRVREQKNANGAATVRRMIDAALKDVGDWTNTKAGDVDWIKCRVINGSRVCVGVEVQISARSDLITRDIVHFQKQMREGQIDVGILILPTDRLSRFLPDRTPSMSDGKRIIDEMRADDLPLLLIGIEHDGPGTALEKQLTNKGKTRES